VFGRAGLVVAMVTLACRREAPTRPTRAPRRDASVVESTVLTRAEEGGRWGFRDARGCWAIAPTYAWAEPFSESLAAVKVGDRWGYVDRAGRVVIEARFRDVDVFSEGLAAVQGDDRGWRYIDASGAVRIAGPF